MNILIGTALVFKVGGVSSHILTLQESLKQAGQEVSLARLRNVSVFDILSAGLKAFGNRDKAYIEVAKSRGNMVAALGEREMLTKTFDLINPHDVFFGNTAKRFNKPIVLTVHGPTSREAKMLGLSDKHFFNYIVECEKFAYKRADHIIAVSNTLKSIIVNDFQIDPGKITVISNAVNSKEFSPTQKNNVTTTKYFLVPCKFVPVKGVNIAIESFQYLKDLDIELWIAGDGPETNNLKGLVRSLCLENKIKMLGLISHDKIGEYMSGAEGIIIPSIPVNGTVEGSPIAALEGMSIGKPVIASNIGGLCEIIVDKINGISFEAGNSKQLAEKIRELTQNPELADLIGKQAREYILDNHCSKVWANKIIQVYQKVIR